MSLFNCPDCQTQISDAAPTCPRCGRFFAPKGPSAAHHQAVGMFGALVVLALGVYAWTLGGGHILFTKEGEGIVWHIGNTNRDR